MFNVYAERATDPDDMERTCNRSLHRENMKAFAYLCDLASSDGNPPDIWAAWGAIIQKRAYLADCVRDMAGIGEARGARWFTCGARSKNGGHPSPAVSAQGREARSVRDRAVSRFARVNQSVGPACSSRMPRRAAMELE